jgi:hypothetical protein
VHELLVLKRFYKNHVFAAKIGACLLFGTQSATMLIGGRISLQDHISADVCLIFLHNIVDAVRASTADARAYFDNLDALQLISEGDVIEAIRRLPNKSCLSDPMLTYFLKWKVHRIFQRF